MKYMRNTLINYVFAQTLKPNQKLKIQVNRSKTCHYILYSIALNQIRVIKQLYHPYRTIRYQIMPPIHHHLNLLTPHYPMNQTQTHQRSNQTQVYVSRETEQNETVDPQHI